MSVRRYMYIYLSCCFGLDDYVIINSLTDANDVGFYEPLSIKDDFGHLVYTHLFSSVCLVDNHLDNPIEY